MLKDIPDSVLYVIQDYYALGYKLTSCLSLESPQPYHQPCLGKLYVVNLLRHMEPLNKAQWATSYNQWQPVNIDKLKAGFEFVTWVTTTHSNVDKEQVISLIENQDAALWAHFRSRSIRQDMLRLTIDESGLVRERYVSNSFYSIRNHSEINNRIEPKREILKQEARQTPPGQPTVTDLLELHDAIRVSDWPKEAYGLVIEITQLQNQKLEFFDIGYVNMGANFIPYSRPNRHGYYRNKQLLRKIIAMNGQLRFVYPPFFAKEPTIEIVAKCVVDRQLKLF